MERPYPLLTLSGFFFFFFFLLPAACQSCPEYQKQALLKFKSSVLAITSSLNTSDDSPLQEWSSSSNSSCCQWYEVRCNDSPNPTSKVVISGLYLDGLLANLSPQSTILAPLFDIRTLEKLYISDNNIQGEILAVGIANLSSLVILYMDGNKLSGSIPPQLFHLPLLRSLFLDGNSLSGEVPEEIGNLTSLQDLSLSGNKFSDTMLRSVVLCLKGLEYLDLSHNYLSMEIPTEIGNLSNIVTLSLNNNRLTGGIPSSLQKLSKLNILHLQNNFLTGEIPSWLFNFEDLWNLFLGGNRLIWNNSAEIAPNSRLCQLSLKSCGLVGEVPKWISTHTSLYFLDLGRNNLHGAFPGWLLEMQLQGLILSDNKLTGSLPPDLFSRLHDIGVLALSRNNFSGELPKNIGNATSLRVLTLSENNFSGPIPQSLIHCLHLQLLDLSRNRFSGSFPVFDPQVGIAYIDFSYNDFSGEVPTGFPEETKFLALGGNKFSGGLPFNLTNLSKLERLELQDSNLTGELPNFLSQISTLQILNLRNNSFRGSIPQSIFNQLSSLRILDISSNNLTGEITEEFHNLVGMIVPPNAPSSLIENIALGFTKTWAYQTVQVSLDFEDLVVNWKNSKQGISSDILNIYTLLDLSNNQLSGHIPASLGALKALKLLNISHNKLNGKIPTSLGDLEHIETLDLSHNNLSGSIPSTLTKLQQLTILDVSNNQLTGRIPDGGQMGTMVLDPNYYANNSGLCGMQIRVPCLEDDGLPLPPPPPTTKTQEHHRKEAWFLWKGVWIGYPVGLLLAMGIIFGTGYFTLSPPLNRQHRPHRPIRV